MASLPLPTTDRPAPAPGAEPGAWTEEERAVLAEANRRRGIARLAPLVGHPALDALAREHSEAMARGDRPFGHGGFEERQRHAAREVPLRAIAENVAYMPSRIQELGISTVDGWIRSPGHRVNLLGEFDLAGTGVARAPDGGFHVTQIYVQRAR